MNFLTEYKIEQYADLVSRIEEIAAESGQAADALKNAEKRPADMAVLIKNISTCQKTKPVYDAYRKARNREKYRAGQEQAIILHEADARSLKACTHRPTQYWGGPPYTKAGVQKAYTNQLAIYSR